MPPDHFKYSYATYYNTIKESAFESAEIYFRDTILEKLDTLKERIEEWAATNGYENLDNSEERKNTETGELLKQFVLKNTWQISVCQY